MSAEDLEKYETEMELSLYREYKDIVGQFSYVVETGAALLSGQQRRVGAAKHRRRGVLRTAPGRRVGVGHVPSGALRQAGPGDHLRDVNIEEVDKPELRLPE